MQVSLTDIPVVGTGELNRDKNKRRRMVSLNDSPQDSGLLIHIIPFVESRHCTDVLHSRQHLPSLLLNHNSCVV